MNFSTFFGLITKTGFVIVRYKLQPHNNVSLWNGHLLLQTIYGLHQHYSGFIHVRDRGKESLSKMRTRLSILYFEENRKE